MYFKTLKLLHFLKVFEVVCDDWRPKLFHHSYFFIKGRLCYSMRQNINLIICSAEGLYVQVILQKYWIYLTTPSEASKKYEKQMLRSEQKNTQKIWIFFSQKYLENIYLPRGKRVSKFTSSRIFLAHLVPNVKKTGWSDISLYN